MYTYTQARAKHGEIVKSRKAETRNFLYLPKILDAIYTRREMPDWQLESFLSFSVKTAEKDVCVTLTLTLGEIVRRACTWERKEDWFQEEKGKE